MKKIYRKITLILLSVLSFYSFQGYEKPVKIFIAGDSTAQTYNEEKDGLIKGWGQMLPLFFGNEVQVVNHAMGGRSTKTFINEGRWDKLLTEVSAGDYVFIQFGHNDASTRPERHTSYDEYRDNLIRMINDARAKNATPVLLTSVVMRTFVDGNLVDDRLKGYPVITRRIAKEYLVPIIDVNLMIHDFITMLGDEDSKSYYRWVSPGEDFTKPEGLQDDTHMMEKGATQVAYFIAEGIKDLKLMGLSEYVKLENQVK